MPETPLTEINREDAKSAKRTRQENPVPARTTVKKRV
jgi:hypothetical protein